MTVPHHEIKIILTTDKEGKRHAVPQLPASGVMNKGDTVHYSSDDGDVRVEFLAGSPFDTNVMTNSDVKELKQPGKFHCGCSIRLKDDPEVTVGWHSPEPVGGPSGGVHNVGPH